VCVCSVYYWWDDYLVGTDAHTNVLNASVEKKLMVIWSVTLLLLLLLLLLLFRRRPSCGGSSSNILENAATMRDAFPVRNLRKIFLFLVVFIRFIFYCDCLLK